MNELNLLLNIQLNQQSGNDNFRENSSLSFDNYMKQMVSSDNESGISESRIGIELLKTEQESSHQNSDDILFHFSNLKVNNLSSDVEGNLASETIYSKLLPMGQVGHGTLSYLTKKYNSQTLQPSQSSQNIISLNNLANTNGNHSPSLLNSTSLRTNGINEFQHGSLKHSEINNRVISDLKKSNELNLSKASYIYNSDEYQLKKLTIVNSETVKLIIIRDYSLSSWQKESLAEAIKEHLSEIHNNFQTSKIIINGKTYGN